MNCSSPGSSVHGFLQARKVEWVAISFSRSSSRTRDWTCVSCVGRQILYHWATRETPTKDAHALFPRTCKYVHLTGQKGPGSVIKLRTLRWKIIVDYLGSPDVIMKIFIKGMQEGERQKKMWTQRPGLEYWAMQMGAKECRQYLAAGKGKVLASPLEPSEAK